MAVVLNNPAAETDRSRASARPWWSWISSAAVHVLIVLLLSYIAVHSTRDEQTIIEVTLTKSAVEDVEFSAPLEALMPTVEVELPDFSENAATVDLSVANESSVSISRQLIADLAPTPASDGVAQAAAARIQGRVSKAGGRSGEIQFSLAWSDRDDLDLHVIAPSGERVCFFNSRSQCRGELDVDMNVSGESREPVENVRWLKNHAPAGRYTVLVNLFQRHTGNRQFDYELFCKVGRSTDIIRHSLTNSRLVTVHRFVYVPPTYSASQQQSLRARFAALQTRENTAARRLLSVAANSRRGQLREQRLHEVVARYPHSEAAVEALQLMATQSAK